MRPKGLIVHPSFQREERELSRLFCRNSPPKGVRRTKASASRQGEFQMPIAKIHVLEGRYAERPLNNVSKAVPPALIIILNIPPDTSFPILHLPPRTSLRHTPP